MGIFVCKLWHRDMNGAVNGRNPSQNQFTTGETSKIFTPLLAWLPRNKMENPSMWKVTQKGRLGSLTTTFLLNWLHSCCIRYS